MMTFAEWMAAEEVSDEAMAAALGVDRSTISRVRRGTMLPSSALIARLVQYSGNKIDPATFFAPPYPLPCPNPITAEPVKVA